MVSSARSMARQANNHPVIEAGARVGYAASGVLHLVIAWLAVQLVLGGNTQSTDQTGALRQLAGTSAGALLLWALLVGFALLGLWNVTEAVARSGKDRAKAAVKIVVFAVLAATAWSVLQGSSSGDKTQGATATLMSARFGVLLVGAVGLVVAGVGVHHVVKGARATFLRDLRQHPRAGVVRLGRVGYIAKGVALGIVGALFVAAAATHDPGKAGGLDAALHALLAIPAGPLFVSAVALGFACYGLYSFARARYAKV